MHGREANVPPVPLARRADFRLAAALVRPSIRMIEGPGGQVPLEPKVMHVLLAFADANGKVITREDLVEECWDGRIVGEDAVNRTIAALRRALRDSAAGASVETIPRIGYRLAIDGAADVPYSSEVDHSGDRSFARRGAIAALAVGGVALGATLIARWTSDQPKGQSALIEKARRALYNGFPDSGTVAAGHLRAAVRDDPDNAEAWGLLAYAYRDIAEGAPPAEVSTAVEASAAAAKRALAINPDQGTALAAQAMLRPYFGEFAAGEDRLAGVLRIDPTNVLAMMQLVALLQGVGRVSDSAEWNNRMLRLDPQSPVALYRRATKFWSRGDTVAADRAADQAMQLWPLHPGVWNARMMIFAYEGRPEAGLAMLDDTRSRPATLKAPGIELWRVSLKALESGAREDIDRAKAANLAAAPRSPGFANNAVMTLSRLGEVDAAFEVAEGYFLRRGPLFTTMWGGAGELPVSALRWRRTMALFVPATGPMRADARFAVLADDMGLTRYWRDRKIVPDYLRSG